MSKRETARSAFKSIFFVSLVSSAYCAGYISGATRALLDLKRNT